MLCVGKNNTKRREQYQASPLSFSLAPGSLFDVEELPNRELEQTGLCK